jgi:hypothetical protein
MKTSLLPWKSLAGAIVFPALSFSGCAGGGGGQAGGFDPDPGWRNPGGAIEPIRQAVRCEGRVLLRTAQNGMEFLPNVKVVARDPDGRIIASAITAIDGTYSLALDPNATNIIAPTHRGYAYSPDEVTLRPRGPQNIPAFVATRIHFPIPGGSQQVPPPPAAGGTRPALLGVIEGRIQIAPNAPALDAILFHDITVRDASTNRILATVRTDRDNRFQYSGPVGATVVLQPRAAAGMRWRPASQSVQIVRGTRSVTFLYDLTPVSGSPRPRLPLLRPAPTPSPGPRPWLN